jgi:hypothetical protein
LRNYIKFYTMELMPKAPSLLSRQNKFKWGVIAASFILVFYFLTFGIFYKKIFTRSTPKPLISIVTPTPLPPYQTFTSDRLGVSFSYPNSVYVKVIDNKIYLYDASGGLRPTGPFTGSDEEFLKQDFWFKRIDVFTKPSQETLIAAIKKQILPNVPTSECDVISTTDKSGVGVGWKYPNYQRAEIRLVSNSCGKELRQMFECAKRCTSYVRFNGIDYFLYNPDQPSKFVWVSIGQQGLNSEEGDFSWEQTIKIF